MQTRPMLDVLFIYGTLHPDRAPREIASAARRLRPMGPARIRGHLYDLGEYPGVIVDGTAATILGELFTVPDAESLAALDAYEDYRPNDAANSLFVRVRTIATKPDGSQLACWVYEYNGEVTDLEPSTNLES